jgi:hypothetical protein
MTVAQDLVQSALEMVNVVGVGQTPATAHLNRGLLVLNRMLDSWSTEPHAVFATRTINFPLVPGQGTYTIGAGGQVNVPRPQDLLVGPGRAYLTDQTQNRYPVEVVPQDKWQMIGNISINSQVPDTAWYDPQFPLGIINIFPLPLISYTITFNTILELVSFATLQTAYAMPQGYQEAIECNLAVELKPYFPAGGALSPVVMKLAMEGKGNIKRANLKEVVAVYDTEIVSRGSPTYNIFRDSSGGATQ